MLGYCLMTSEFIRYIIALKLVLIVSEKIKNKTSHEGSSPRKTMFRLFIAL